MAYDKLIDLPKSVRNVLPKRAQEIFLAAFNNAWKEYGHEEERAYRVAWAAVKREYEKDKSSGRWRLKKSK
jgi:cation transport regulator